jgi:hypothetical protein
MADRDATGCSRRAQRARRTRSEFKVTQTVDGNTDAATTTTYKNHGDYVSVSGGGKAAAQSCVGMPLNSKQGKDHPKTAAGFRTVEVAAPLAQRLMKVPAESPDAGPTAPILCSLTGKPFDDHNIRRALRGASKRLGLPYTPPKRRREMVRKGSPVRVRQRASRKGRRRSPFSFPETPAGRRRVGGQIARKPGPTGTVGAERGADVHESSCDAG